MIGAVYVVTDADAPLSLREQALAAARGGAWAVQLRDKRASDAELVVTARALVEALRPMGVKLIVNDRIDVAIAAGACGLHLGQSDGDPVQARERLAAGAILGVSVNTTAHLAKIRPGVDYVGVGPLRATPSKPDHATPLGFAGLAAIAANASVPIVAIGGIRHGDARALRAAGVAGMAVVSAVSRAPDPEAATRALVEEWRSA